MFLSEYRVREVAQATEKELSMNTKNTLSPQSMMTDFASSFVTDSICFENSASKFLQIVNRVLVLNLLGLDGLHISHGETIGRVLKSCFIKDTLL